FARRRRRAGVGGAFGGRDGDRVAEAAARFARVGELGGGFGEAGGGDRQRRAGDRAAARRGDFDRVAAAYRADRVADAVGDGDLCLDRAAVAEARDRAGEEAGRADAAGADRHFLEGQPRRRAGGDGDGEASRRRDRAVAGRDACRLDLVQLHHAVAGRGDFG